MRRDIALVPRGGVGTLISRLGVWKHTIVYDNSNSRKALSVEEKFLYKTSTLFSPKQRLRIVLYRVCKIGAAGLRAPTPTPMNLQRLWPFWLSRSRILTRCFHVDSLLIGEQISRTKSEYVNRFRRALVTRTWPCLI